MHFDTHKFAPASGYMLVNCCDSASTKARMALPHRFQRQQSMLQQQSSSARRGQSAYGTSVALDAAAVASARDASPVVRPSRGPKANLPCQPKALIRGEAGASARQRKRAAARRSRSALKPQRVASASEPPRTEAAARWPPRRRRPASNDPWKTRSSTPRSSSRIKMQALPRNRNRSTVPVACRRTAVKEMTGDKVAKEIHDLFLKCANDTGRQFVQIRRPLTSRG